MEKKEYYTVKLANFDEAKTKLPEINFDALPKYTFSQRQVINGKQYEVNYVECNLILNKTQYRKIQKYDISKWSKEKWNRHFKIQKPGSKYQMIPDFGYPRELCISVFRTKIQTDKVWMKRALQIIAENFTDKEKRKYRSLEHNNIGANRADSPRIIYCCDHFNYLTDNEVKYLKEVLAKYAAQIIKFSDKDKLKKFFDKYFNAPVPF